MFKPGNLGRFIPGNTITFDYDSFNKTYWDRLSEKDKVKYYGPIGYKADPIKLYTFICEMSPQFGHMVIIEIGTGKIETMRHVNDFRLATEDEC